MGQRVYAHAPQVHVPHLLDLEVAQVLRRFVREGRLTPTRAEIALHDLMDARLIRHGHAPLLPRIWQMRNNLTAYDAAYLALAELLDAVLLTRDRKLSSAAGHHACIECI